MPRTKKTAQDEVLTVDNAETEKPLETISEVSVTIDNLEADNAEIKVVKESEQNNSKEYQPTNTELSNDDSDTYKLDESTKKESPLLMVIEGSRSTTKSVIVSPDGTNLFINFPSVVYKSDEPLTCTGAFTAYKTVSEKTDEPALDKEGNPKKDKKGEPIMKRKTTTVKEHWVVGQAALKKAGHIKMTDGANHKEQFFAQLFGGSLANQSDTDLMALSSPGDKKGKTRMLNLQVITQSIASSKKLREQLASYKAIEFKGTKFKLKVSKEVKAHPENFGVAKFAFDEQKSDGKDYPDVIGTVDCGEGTLMDIPYNIRGSVPSDNDAYLHGGGGMASLKMQFLKTAGEYDTSSGNDIEYLQAALMNADWVDNKVVIKGENYQHLSGALQLAIENWLTQTQAQVAVRNTTKIGLRYPLYLCGGGFGCKPVYELFKAELIKNGVPPHHIKLVEDPQFLGVKYTGEFYAKQQSA